MDCKIKRHYICSPFQNQPKERCEKKKLEKSFGRNKKVTIFASALRDEAKKRSSLRLKDRRKIKAKCQFDELSGGRALAL
ncbi:hypothetical protein EQP59_04355 [Ornithobacterium rhinotracheale]|uniref:Uncharacterized protein n=1 Tax=Ornithobacterium rhinotracheale TaxID=28251 RepID=A0A3R5UVE4_ORNRH|nr:hypothetical protein [Ornithobacterium rhinotracheale]QAR30637.1 hypothetical protein EQP59_04355 [Ornithobacterium rhinotracheale]